MYANLEILLELIGVLVLKRELFAYCLGRVALVTAICTPTIEQETQKI